MAQPSRAIRGLHSLQLVLLLSFFSLAAAPVPRTDQPPNLEVPLTTDMELERIPTSRDPWALLPEQPPVAMSPEIPDLNRFIREEEQSAADAQIERHIETFSVFAFFGGGTFL
jgi:hypothetical protein